MPRSYDALLSTLRATAHEDVTTAAPASAESIARAEAELGVAFPPQYRRFLESLGALDVAPREVYGIEGSGVASVVAETLRWRGTDGMPAGAVVLEVDGVEGAPIGFVSGASDAAPEPPIQRWEPHGAVSIAVDFADYLAAVAEEVVPSAAEAPPGRAFDPPWGQMRSGGAISVDRKEAKLAYTIVQRIKYDGVSWAKLVDELNTRRIPARKLPAWTVDAAKEAYEAWKDRY